MGGQTSGVRRLTHLSVIYLPITSSLLSLPVPKNGTLMGSKRSHTFLKNLI